MRDITASLKLKTEVYLFVNIASNNYDDLTLPVPWSFYPITQAP
jgi:hypothetical protein